MHPGVANSASADPTSTTRREQIVLRRSAGLQSFEADLGPMTTPLPRTATVITPPGHGLLPIGRPPGGQRRAATQPGWQEKRTTMSPALRNACSNSRSATPAPRNRSRSLLSGFQTFLYRPPRVTQRQESGASAVPVPSAELIEFHRAGCRTRRRGQRSPALPAVPDPLAGSSDPRVSPAARGVTEQGRWSPDQGLRRQRGLSGQSGTGGPDLARCHCAIRVRCRRAGPASWPSSSWCRTPSAACCPCRRARSCRRPAALARTTPFSLVSDVHTICLPRPGLDFGSFGGQST